MSPDVMIFVIVHWHNSLHLSGGTNLQKIAMNKILCPIDFSEASKNGMEYAANLAKVLKATHITLRAHFHLARGHPTGEGVK